ncbi:MAG TPA: cytochrome c oxidase subunit II [Acidobacteriota bacterium]|nr:cytochrome c oxidase subunit II [Acidobacteriota bacterium]HQM63820.1 cytochrome c oxidase subunit II [Acidobacteriota bacterium]
MNTPTSTFTSGVDQVFLLIVGISVVMLALVTVLMIYFVIRYHRRRHPKPEKVTQHTWLEITWTVIPTILVLVMFWFSFSEFRKMRDVPADALTVQVIGRMWDWAFEYPNGKRTDKLYVPLDRAVRLELKSVDVNHSFYIPAFRVKEDVVPGRQNFLWFRPQSMGPADIYCAEYCGQNHAYMMSKVIVMSQSEFDTWYNEGAPEPESGAPAVLALMDDQGCLTCHSVDGSPGAGPTFKGIFNRRTVILVNGREREIAADEAYLRRAILEPNAEIVTGAAMEMPASPDPLSAEDVDAIIAYLKNLK